MIFPIDFVKNLALSLARTVKLTVSLFLITLIFIAMTINNELWFIGGCCGVLPGIERLNVSTGKTITENIGELEERYNFAALYFS